MPLGLCMKNTSELNKQLDALYLDLDVVQRMSEESVCATFNADSKKELIDTLNDEIDRLEDLLDEDEMEDWEEQEAERTCLCVSQGLSRY